jgi:phosphoserine aminotransferase
MSGLNLDYMLSLGGVDELSARTRTRADLMYRCIDQSQGYYVNKVDKKYRSRINIPFSVCDNAELETKFLTEAAEINLIELKDPNVEIGCSASLYNAMPFEGIFALINFMKDFMKDNPKA